MKTFEKFILLFTAVIFLLSGCGDTENTLPNTTQVQTQANNFKESNFVQQTQEISEVQSALEDFILIKGGTFEIGSSESENWRGNDET